MLPIPKNHPIKLISMAYNGEVKLFTLTGDELGHTQASSGITRDGEVN